MAERMTYLLVDGENIDATLGTSILGRRPRPEERPRWDRLLEWAERAFDQDVSGLFFPCEHEPAAPAPDRRHVLEDAVDDLFLRTHKRCYLGVVRAVGRCAAGLGGRADGGPPRSGRHRARRRVRVGPAGRVVRR